MNDAAIERACIDATLRFFRALDMRDARAAADLMTADGVWDRQGTLVRGRAAIFTVIDARPAERATAHIITNISADIVDATHAVVAFYLTAYEGALSSGAVPVAQLGLIRSGIDRFALGDEGWRIEHKSTAAIMRGA